MKSIILFLNFLVIIFFIPSCSKIPEKQEKDVVVLKTPRSQFQYIIYCFQNSSCTDSLIQSIIPLKGGEGGHVKIANIKNITILNLNNSDDNQVISQLFQGIEVVNRHMAYRKYKENPKTIRLQYNQFFSGVIDREKYINTENKIQVQNLNKEAFDIATLTLEKVENKTNNTIKITFGNVEKTTISMPLDYFKKEVYEQYFKNIFKYAYLNEPR